MWNLPSFCTSMHIEVWTVLVLVESTGPWLHAGACPVFVCYHDKIHLLILHIDQLVHFMERNMKCIEKYLMQVYSLPTCSQGPVYSNIVGILICLETPQQEMTNVIVRLLMWWPWSMFSQATKCWKQLQWPKMIVKCRDLAASHWRRMLSKSRFRESTNNTVWK